MTKVVFTWKQHSDYDDEPGVRYNFPRQYIERVRQAIGDWSVWHELHDRGRGRSAYVSLARVVEVEPDQRHAGWYYAVLTDAVDLPVPVPVIAPDGPFEARLKALPGTNKRPAIRDAVRLLPDREFDRILQAGMSGSHDPGWSSGFREDQAAYEPRRIELSSRAIRDSMFRERVLRAYGSRCALTGLRLVNGGGAAEVEAAHIVPVAYGGPDKVRNGIALTRSVHWMFDRLLITFDDDLGLIRTAMLDAEARRFLGNVSHLRPPGHDLDRPSPIFLAHHRERAMRKEAAFLGR